MLDLDIDRLSDGGWCVGSLILWLTFREWNHLCFSDFHIDCSADKKLCVMLSCVLFLSLGLSAFIYMLESSCFGFPVPTRHWSQHLAGLAVLESAKGRLVSNSNCRFHYLQYWVVFVHLCVWTMEENPSMYTLPRLFLEPGAMVMHNR